MTGEPAYGTGEVVINVSLRPPSDSWQAHWLDAQGHIVQGPQHVPFDDCLSWALNDAKPARIVIWTQHHASDDDRDPNARIPFDPYAADESYRPTP